MSKKKKSKSSFNLIKNIFIRLLLVGVVVGGFYAYKNPSVLGLSTEEKLFDNMNSSSDGDELVVKSKNIIDMEKISKILGDTTSLVAEGLETIKVPKRISGTNEEIVIQDIVDGFTEKVKNLPEEQVDHMKIQFCQDLLSGVEDVSVVKN